LSYGPGLDAAGLAAATRNMVQVGAELRGTRIALAIEPEADGALANVSDLIEWWPDALDATVCFDACHSAVAYEEPEVALDALDAAGIRVGKAQLSAALTVPASAHAELRAFADPIYLHQVTERGSGRTWPDLPEALAANGGGDEWRVHFHVPIFVERYGALESTQDHLRRCIERVRTAHLEIETYTWDVLPAGLKASSVDSIAREYEWVLDVLG